MFSCNFLDAQTYLRSGAMLIFPLRDAGVLGMGSELPPPPPWQRPNLSVLYTDQQTHEPSKRSEFARNPCMRN